MIVWSFCSFLQLQRTEIGLTLSKIIVCLITPLKKKLMVRSSISCIYYGKNRISQSCELLLHIWLWNQSFSGVLQKHMCPSTAVLKCSSSGSLVKTSEKYLQKLFFRRVTEVKPAILSKNDLLHNYIWRT